MDTPSSLIISDSMKVTVLYDETGRQLCLRRVSGLDRLRLFKALGPELSQNLPYLGVALLAVSVTAIDNVPVPSPVTEAQVESLVQRLGDEGLIAIAAASSEDVTDDAELAKTGN